MNVKRFTARNSRDALGLVKQAFGQDAVVLSTRPCAEGVEVLAMPPDAVPTTPARPAPRPALPTPAALAESPPSKDAERLSMSTLSFQDYVRERMLRRRKAEMQAQMNDSGAAPATSAPAVPLIPAMTAAPVPARTPSVDAIGAAASSVRLSEAVKSLVALDVDPPPAASERLDPLKARSMASTRRYVSAGAPAPEPSFGDDGDFQPYGSGEPPMLHAVVSAPADAPSPATQEDAQQMLRELREVRELVDQRFGALAYQEKLQRDPRAAQLLMRLFQAGFSPAMTRRLTDHLPADVQPLEWAAGVLQRNLLTAEREAALEDAGGVYAFVGGTGCGKTTGTAKLAATFAARHGAAQLGIITLDLFNSGSGEALRAYGKALGVTVHTAQDRTSLDDLIDLLRGRRLILIDTPGLAAHDPRTRDLLETLGHPLVRRLLVLNATSQGEMLDEQVNAFRASDCHGVVLSKVDEAARLAPALDTTIRYKLKVCAVGNGQRVPDDWHRLGAHVLIQRALRSREGASWKVQADDVNLLFLDTRHAQGTTA